MMAATGHEPCLICRGRGWKFRMIRRSLANGGETAERGLLARSRVTCLVCSGTGQAAAQ
jgi:hypothetical protein